MPTSTTPDNNILLLRCKDALTTLKGSDLLDDQGVRIVDRNLRKLVSVLCNVDACSDGARDAMADGVQYVSQLVGRLAAVSSNTKVSSSGQRVGEGDPDDATNCPTLKIHADVDNLRALQVCSDEMQTFLGRRFVVENSCDRVRMKTMYRQYRRLKDCPDEETKFPVMSFAEFEHELEIQKD